VTGKAEAIEQKVLETYCKRTPTSKAHHEKAAAYLPGGDTRTTCYFAPYPAYMQMGSGCRLYDCDGNEYLDYLSNYTSLIFGHAHPALTRATKDLVEHGTTFGAAAEIQYLHARHLIERVPSLEKVRYGNSGTEATLFALRAARAFTGRDLVIKMDGGYHGTHDLVEVNVHPDVNAEGMPAKQLIAGVPASTLQDVLIAPFNDLNAVEDLVKAHQDKLAAVIVEPIMGAGGLICPQPEYLQGLREITTRYDIILIFDEIISFRVHRGGMQTLEGVTPDMTTLGKWIGGGFPVGAFGGRSDIMAVYDPTKPGSIAHGGTFNANNMTLGAGLVALDLVDQPAIDRLNRLGDRLREGMQAALKKAEVKAQISGYGSMLGLHWREEMPRNAKEAAQGVAKAGRLPALFHLEMLNRGIYSAPRGMFIISMPMGEHEVDECIEAFEGVLAAFRPYIEEKTPHLLV
jgi:glutamate-1-semialdehyde 2,1-aminomutase